jgi:hypothetical protein
MGKRITVRIGGPRPPYDKLAKYLWGAVDFDSDGDSVEPGSTNWTELTLINRQDETQRIDVDPISESPLLLEIRSESEELAARTARFLADQTHGHIVEQGTWHRHRHRVGPSEVLVFRTKELLNDTVFGLRTMFLTSKTLF